MYIFIGIQELFEELKDVRFEGVQGGSVGWLPYARAVLLLLTATLVALLDASGAVPRTPRLLAGATAAAFLVALAGIAVALVRPEAFPDGVSDG